ncbi:MAG TPA: hypothetical protein VNU95_07175 [Candidatus Acidoferrales bacterium]|jgi:hypothetical protein|nr:hypothetical protein [Candidatus Acidoferrales bacterium]
MKNEKVGNKYEDKNELSLTPALSRWERENRRQMIITPTAVELKKSADAFQR